jgi:ketosteroid isomerase-like protein
MINTVMDRSSIDRRRSQMKTRPVGIAGAGTAMKLMRCCVIALLAVFISARHADNAEPDPLSVVKALIDAERATNLDAAIALFADDAFVLNAVGWKTADRNELRWFINMEIRMRDDFELNNLQVNGDVVSWTEAAMAPFYKRIGVAPVQFAFEATIQRGKITSIVAHLPVGEIARITEACQAKAKEPLIHGRPCSEFVQLAEARTRRHLHPARRAAR